MSEELKAKVRRFYAEAWNAGQLDVIDELFADDYVDHDAATQTGGMAGKESARAGKTATHRHAWNTARDSRWKWATAHLKLRERRSLPTDPVLHPRSVSPARPEAPTHSCRPRSHAVPPGGVE